MDLEGRTLALATHAPAHLGSTLRLVPAILERFPLDQMQPGDAFLANDPYIVGVTHLNDCTLATPIFDATLPIYQQAMKEGRDNEDTAAVFAVMRGDKK